MRKEVIAAPFKDFAMNLRRRKRPLAIFAGGEVLLYAVARLTGIPNALPLTTAIGNVVAFYFAIVRDYLDSGTVKR